MAYIHIFIYIYILNNTYIHIYIYTYIFEFATDLYMNRDERPIQGWGPMTPACHMKPVWGFVMFAIILGGMMARIITKTED